MPKTRLTFVLPEPPSANRYWRVANGRPYLSAEAKGYKQHVAAIAHYETRGQVAFPSGKTIAVTLTWYRSARRGDLDNRAKVALDALNGIVWDDDAQIVELHLYRKDRPKDGALHLTVEERPNV